MIHIEVPLVMKGGISIRQYAAKKNEPDFVHITSNGVPVISGSSFAGAIRHRVEQILGELEAGGTKLPVKKKEILKGILGHCTDRVFIESPVHMSYGNHVHLGDQFMPISIWSS